MNKGTALPTAGKVRKIHLSSYVNKSNFGVLNGDCFRENPVDIYCSCFPIDERGEDGIYQQIHDNCRGIFPIYCFAEVR